jgi:hypothetical protein
MTRICALLLALLAGASAAPAATLTATVTAANSVFSGFAITYTDKNGNSLVDYDEITNFSGPYQYVSDQYPFQMAFV